MNCHLSRVAALCLVLLPVASTAATVVEGRVVDDQGRGVAATIVSLSAGGTSARAASDLDGRFVISWPGPLQVVISADAPGYEVTQSEIQLRAGSPLTLTVSAAARRSEELTVTATGRNQRLSDTPASVAVLSSADLQTTGTLALDDALRQVPGFTLFRRASSRYANPTTQGASLRGVSGSGAGRAAVFDDGVPLADPFGGWIHWSRVPRTSVERLEVLRGGASDLYGGGALAGVVYVVRRGTEEPHLEAELGVGSSTLAEGSFSAGGRRGGWGLRVGAEVISTDGYIAVPAALRGPVDEPLSSLHHSADLLLERHQGWGRVFVRANDFRDHRENGTVIQDNQTALRHGIVGVDARLFGGSLVVRADRLREDYDQSFSAIAADRQTERRTSEQAVPSRAAGLSSQWTRVLGASHTVLVGAERRGVRGSSQEQLFAATGSAPTLASAGGEQRTTGVFLEDIWSPSRRLALTGSVRFDRWRNFAAFQTQGTQRTELPSRSQQVLSPRATALFRLSEHFSLTGAAYRAFRPPTLNELYRSFRVGNVLTQARPTLEAERSRGLEGGALLSFSRFSLRATRFSMDVSRTIANVTVSTTSALITRERQNLGGIRSSGVEVETEARLFDDVTVSAAWMLSNSVVRSAPSDPRLLGLRVPQVPRHQGSLQVRRVSAGGLTWGVQARFGGRQFDDDQNLLPLASFRVIDLLMERPVSGQVLGFLAVENLENNRVEIGRTPVLTVSPGRSFRAGVRVRMAARPPANP